MISIPVIHSDHSEGIVSNITTNEALNIPPSVEYLKSLFEVSSEPEIPP
jgi:hypothetical protein